MKSLKPYRLKDNPKEQEFVEKFMSDYSRPNHIVFGAKSVVGNPPADYLTEREEDIVLSTIQWLGSPVGQGFLRECGFELKSK